MSHRITKAMSAHPVLVHQAHSKQGPGAYRGQSSLPNTRLYRRFVAVYTLEVAYPGPAPRAPYT